MAWKGRNATLKNVKMLDWHAQINNNGVTLACSLVRYQDINKVVSPSIISHHTSLNSNLPHRRHGLLLGAQLIVIKHIEGDCSRGDCFPGPTHFVLNPNPNPAGDCNNRRHLPKPYDPYWSQPRSKASSPKLFKCCQHHIAGGGSFTGGLYMWLLTPSCVSNSH